MQLTILPFSVLLLTVLTRPLFVQLLRLSIRRRIILGIGAYAIGSLLLFFVMHTDHFTRKEHDSLTLLLISISLIAGASILMIPMCLLTISLAVAVAYLGSAVLLAGELIVRRIAEYPKGPVLGLGIVFGGIAALIKAFH